MFLLYFLHTCNISRVKRLERFFWRACLSLRYSSGAEANIKDDLREIDKMLKGEEPKFDFPLTLSLESLKDCDLSLSNAYCKSVLCYLASLRPRNFENDGLVNLQNSNLARANSKQYHHFFPKNYLIKKKGIFERVNSVVNICFIPADSNLNIRDNKPLDYLNEIEKKFNPELKKTLKSHLIFDFDAFGITADNYEEFLTARAEAILNGLDEKVAANR